MDSILISEIGPTDAQKSAARQSKTAYNAKYPERLKAYKAVNKAMRKGTLQRKPCSVCGRTRPTHAHHDDYSRPLDIIWLCAKHHKARHRWLKTQGWDGKGLLHRSAQDSV